MSHNIENDILIGCDECIIDIIKRIKEKRHFDIKEFRDTIQESRKETLEFIIVSLYNSKNCIEKPQSCRDKITQSLLEHGQFSREEVDEVFNKYSHESTNYTQEFIKNHPEVDFNDFFLPIKNKYVELNYNFPFSGCDYKNYIGFCKIDIDILKCPDCGGEVTNTPDNVTYGYEHNLVCPVCLIKRNDEFDNKGLIKAGRPNHHGNWIVQKPELVYTGTDYFAIFHPICSKSTRQDKKGLMEVNGIWVDDSGRIVLSLECAYCGARNALKPFTKKGEIPLLNESGAAWKRVESPILELIENGENEKVEFKSSLRWDCEKNNLKKELEYEVARACAGFMNVNGGILLVGVSDDKNVLGIENDYKTLGKNKKNKDGFELQLTEVINRYIGKEYRKYLVVEFENIQGKDICFIEIYKSSGPVFLEKDKIKTFVIRSGNRTQTLDVKETTEHIKTHWKELY